MARMISRDGFALPAALLALVVVGALVTGGIYAAMEEDRASANVDHGHHAFMAAERGLQDVLGTRTKPYFQNDVGPVGAADTIGPVAVTVNGVQAQYTVFVQRLNSRLFKVESEGEVVSGGRYAGSKRRLAEMMRITYTNLPLDRAVTSHGPIRMRGQSGISGTDTFPPAWTECSDTGTQKSVVAKHDNSIDVKGAVSLTGDTAVNPTLDADDFVAYGDMRLGELKVMANHLYPTSTTLSSVAPVESGGMCIETAAGNWGDPVNPSGACHYYWPIIYAQQDLHISGSGRGQGILIVDGNLSIVGGFEFTGIVFIFGSLTAAGNGNKFIGSVNILNQDPTGVNDLGDPSKGQGSTLIQLSSCAIERAYLYNERFARPIPLAERKFVDISGLGVD